MKTNEITNPYLKYSIWILAIFATIIIFSFINKSMKTEEKTNEQVASPTNKISNDIVLKTNFGDIELQLFSDKTPVTVNNFIKLVKSGFYDGTRFHRVMEGFMIQGGDPLSKDLSKKAQWGQGGPGYKFDDEISVDSHNSLGTIAMANSGPNTNGSQFFINVNDNNFLDGKYTVFGKVIKGMDVVMKISQTETTENSSGTEKSSPVKDVVLEEATIR